MRKSTVILVITGIIIGIIVMGWQLLSLKLSTEEKDEPVEIVKYLEITPPVEVYWSKFLYHPEAWNKVFNNISTIPEFWNTTIPTNLTGKSIPRIAEIFGADVYVNDFEYAFCHISVLDSNYTVLEQTFESLGFYVRDVEFGELLNTHAHITDEKENLYLKHFMVKIFSPK